MCELENPIQCFSNEIDNNNPDECEVQILEAEELSACQYTALEVKGNYIDYIPEINLYLIVFSILDILKLHLETEIKTKELQGIFLLDDIKGKLIYKNEKLNFQHVSVCKLFISNNIYVNITENNLSNVKIKLNNLRLDDIKSNQFSVAER